MKLAECQNESVKLAEGHDENINESVKLKEGQNKNINLGMPE